MKKLAWFLCTVLFVVGCAKKDSGSPPVGEKAGMKSSVVAPAIAPTKVYIGPPVSIKPTETPIPEKTPPPTPKETPGPEKTPPTTITIVPPK